MKKEKEFSNTNEENFESEQKLEKISSINELDKYSVIYEEESMSVSS
jgi:hypothetical protein